MHLDGAGTFEAKFNSDACGTQLEITRLFYKSPAFN